MVSSSATDTSKLWPIKSVTAKSITVLPSGKPLGAEVPGVDLRAIDDAAFAAIHQAWNDHSVLLFRGQTLTDDDLIAFSQRFGRPSGPGTSR